MTTRIWFLALPVSLALVACQPGQSASSAQAVTPAPAVHQPVVAIQDAMLALVDPSADAVWESVSTTITKKGEEVKQPRSDEEWNEVRLHTLRIIAGAALLQTDGIAVVRDGVKIEDTHESYLNEAGIAAAIAKDPSQFKAAAKSLQSTAQEVLVAVNKRDTGAIIQLGAKLDAACEHCHSTYWYPNQKIPGWPARLGDKPKS